MLNRFFFFVFVPMVLFTVWCYSLLKGALPLPEQRLEADALTASVALRRDEQGYLTIEAQTDNDAFFAMGYAHA